MARYFYSPYRRRGSRRYSKSVKSMKMSRAFKASAANMTQNAKFNINVKTPKDVDFTGSSGAPGAAQSFIDLDIPALISGSAMHLYLSNVFDQYRIEKVTVKILPLINPDVSEANKQNYQSVFTVVDRTGFSTGVTIDQLRTYSSYKETCWPTNGDSVRPHYVSIGQTDVVNRSQYYDTKTTSVFPKVKLGVDLGQAATANYKFTFTIEIDAQVRYRGVRLDTSNVSTRLSTNSF